MPYSFHGLAQGLGQTRTAAAITFEQLQRLIGSRRMPYVFLLPNLLIFGICANLAALFYYKYTGLFFKTLNAAGGEYTLPDIVLPLGISFFTFKTLSYTIDVYRRARSRGASSRRATVCSSRTAGRARSDTTPGARPAPRARAWSRAGSTASPPWCCSTRRRPWCSATSATPAGSPTTTSALAPAPGASSSTTRRRWSDW